MQDQFKEVSMNARAIEEMLLTENDVESIGDDDAEDIIRRCNQIIDVMEWIAMTCKEGSDD